MKIQFRKGLSILLRSIIFCREKEVVENPSRIGEIDRISELPEFIVHHILSFFNTLHDTPAELVRMSVLSKTWFDLTASFPILDFYMDNFRSRETFFKYVEYTTSRFCNQMITAHTLKIDATIREPAELDTVNRCLQLVLKNGVKVLVIDIMSSPLVKYRLPNILLTVSVLKSLTITNCNLPSSLMVDVVRFKSLIQLILKNVSIDDEMIKYQGLKRFCVYGHQNLQKVWIDYNTPIERINIEAPRLYDLCVVDRNETGAPQMNLASCNKLETVSYFGHPLPNSNGFTDFLSNFPYIQNLVLATKYKCNNIKLSSHSLKTLVLHSNCDLEDIEFNTPNLVLFIYSRNYCLIKPLITDVFCPLITDIFIKYIVSSLVKHSTHLKACMQYYPEGCIDAIWFHKLRLFLDNKNGFKVLNLYIHAINSQFIELEKLKAIDLSPYELVHVELQLDPRTKSSDLVTFVDAVFWCCHPRSLTLRSPYHFTGLKDAAKFAYAKLLQQKDQDHTMIHIVSPSSPEEKNYFADLKSSSMALPCEGMNISFINEEGGLGLYYENCSAISDLNSYWLQRVLKQPRKRLYVIMV